jgi:hypothetical protein
MSLIGQMPQPIIRPPSETAKTPSVISMAVLANRLSDQWKYSFETPALANSIAIAGTSSVINFPSNLYSLLTACASAG